MCGSLGGSKPKTQAPTLGTSKQAMRREKDPDGINNNGSGGPPLPGGGSTPSALPTDPRGAIDRNGLTPPDYTDAKLKTMLRDRWSKMMLRGRRSTFLGGPVEGESALDLTLLGG